MKTNMPMISCDMRYGRTDEQKRALSAGLLRVVGEATGETRSNATSVKSVSEELGTLAKDIRGRVEGFFEKLRVA